MTVQTITSVDDYLGCPGSVFARIFEHARTSDPRIGEATSEFLAEDGTRYFLHADERSGFAIRFDGELVFVFSTVPGRGDALASKAVMFGATYLDRFDGYLPEFYARHGFTETNRLPNWTDGAPDVVFMRQAHTDQAALRDLPA